MQWISTGRFELCTTPAAHLSTAKETFILPDKNQNTAIKFRNSNPKKMAISEQISIRDEFELCSDKLDDLTLLDRIDDVGISEHLSKRHAEGSLYTSIGDTLVCFRACCMTELCSI